MSFAKRPQRASILISTGEVSGDVIGAHLAESLLRLAPAVELFGVGGERMGSAGVKILHDTNPLGSVGITESLATVPGIWRTFAKIRRRIHQRVPDAAVLIGHEVFHLLLGRWLRRRGVPTVVYFPPQVWLWRRLARPIARSFDWILTSFREEHAVYGRAGGRVWFVGHYLRDLLQPVSAARRRATREALGIAPCATVVGILPGSRLHEIQQAVPLLADTVCRLSARKGAMVFLMPVADRLLEERLCALLRGTPARDKVRLSPGGHRTMAACDLLLVCSGTATLEAALMEIPMVIFYRLEPLSWMTVKFLDRSGLIESKTVGLPNLLARRALVPELRQYRAQGQTLAQVAWNLLRDARRRAAMITGFREVAAQMGSPGSLERAARAVLEIAGHGTVAGNILSCKEVDNGTSGNPLADSGRSTGRETHR